MLVASRVVDMVDRFVVCVFWVLVGLCGCGSVNSVGLFATHLTLSYSLYSDLVWYLLGRLLFMFLIWFGF